MPRRKSARCWVTIIWRNRQSPSSGPVLRLDCAFSGRTRGSDASPRSFLHPGRFLPAPACDSRSDSEGNDRSGFDHVEAQARIFFDVSGVVHRDLLARFDVANGLEDLGERPLAVERSVRIVTVVVE